MIGSKLTTYTSYVASLDGYHENELLNDLAVEPASIGNQNFFLEFTEAEGEAMSGVSEDATIHFSLTVLFELPGKNKLSTNMVNIWNAIGELERKIYNYAASQGDHIRFDLKTLRDYLQNWKVATLTGRLIYRRDLSVS